MLILITGGCGKNRFPGEKFFAIKWKILKVVISGESEPELESPGHIEFREDGTGHFYFEFSNDTLDTDFTYTIDCFERPWPQDEHPESTGEDNGPNRVTLYNCIMNGKGMGRDGTINFSIEYLKKRKKMTFLYDELFNWYTPFDNIDGTKLYFICEAY
jgi:hypothetical protein